MFKKFFFRNLQHNPKSQVLIWLFSFYSQLLGADLVLTPEMEKGKLIFVPAPSGLIPGC